MTSLSESHNEKAMLKDSVRSVIGWMWWQMPVIPARRRLRGEDCSKPKASSGYTARPCLEEKENQQSLLVYPKMECWCVPVCTGSEGAPLLSLSFPPWYRMGSEATIWPLGAAPPH